MARSQSLIPHGDNSLLLNEDETNLIHMGIETGKLVPVRFAVMEMENHPRPRFLFHELALTLRLSFVLK